MNLKSLLYYDIIREKYGKLVKIKKLVTYGKIGPSSLKKIPTTNCVLKKMPTAHGDSVGCCFFLPKYGLSLSKETLKKNLLTCQNCGLGKLDQAYEKIKNCLSMELLVKPA